MNYEITSISINRRLRETAVIANQASKAKTQFLSAMSHDIRTPMNAVIGMINIAKRNINNPEYVEECLEKAMRAGKQLLTLINDVLDISKIESGKLVLNNEEVCLDDTIDELMEMVESAVNDKNINISCDYSNIKYKYVYADQLRLNQIFINLLTNAIKYTHAGGKIDLCIHEEESLQGDGYTCLVFKVSDNGIGMTEEFQKNMYNSFSRAVNTQVNNIQGTGLGLSIVKQIVDMMKGTITCKSFPGKGTTFTVNLTLPVVNKAKEDNELSDNDNVISGNMHLLVAEDNDINWEIVKVMLEEYGITCDRADNGKTCVDMISKADAGTYDGILMDVQMPVMNGREATRIIRSLSDEKIKNIPIIAMTADAFAEDVQKCLECGMNGHIAKPLDMNKLIMYLKKIENGNL